MSSSPRVRPFRTAAITVVAGALVLGALPAASAGSGGSSGVPARRGVSVTLRVMELNTEYGGALVRFRSNVEAIQAAAADIVAIEEGWGNIPRLAAALGFHYSVRLQIVSRFPLLELQGAKGLYALVQLAPGQVVAIGNVHLPSGPYGPNLVRGGATRAQVLEVERRVRLPAVRPTVDALTQLVDAGIPAFLVGDFNAPSHRDWIDATVGLRPQIRYPVHWPVSAFVERAGFVDSFRAVHPDPITAQGLTWPAARPRVDGWNPGPNAPADRIDFVYAAGDVTTTESRLVGEVGGPGVEIAIDPWPTDHRGTVSTFAVEPATPPTFLASERRWLEVGDPLRVTFHGAGTPDERILVAPRGQTDAPVIEVPTGGGVDGTVAIPTDGWAPDRYEVYLGDGSGLVVGAHVTIAAVGARPLVVTDRASYRPGQRIRVHWENAPGQRWDWIGVYERGADPNVASYLTWFYTHASIQGAGVLHDASEGPWPLEPGRYSVYLLADDGYRVLARARFVVHD